MPINWPPWPSVDPPEGKEVSSLSNLLPSYNLLSIGQRGVGKTVFLAACYLECHQDREQRRWLWLDGKNAGVCHIVEQLLLYVAKTGEYPPATLKITSFDFFLRQRRQWGLKTLAQINWWDVPGEICNSHNSQFIQLLEQAQGGCLFVEASLLIHQADNPRALARILEPLATVAEMVAAGVRPFPLALVITKCDLLSPQALSWQRLQRALAPLLEKLQYWQQPHQVFYSEIPIVEQDGVPRLFLNRVSTPLYWLVQQFLIDQEGGDFFGSQGNPPEPSSGGLVRSGSFKGQTRVLLMLLFLMAGLGISLYALREWSFLSPSPLPQESPQPLVP